LLFCREQNVGEMDSVGAGVLPPLFPVSQARFRYQVSQLKIN
jgi:hypothetical protein